MYRVTIYNDSTGTIIHEPTVSPDDPHLYTGTLTQGSSGEIDSLQFDILPNNPGYDLLASRTTMVQVMDTTNNTAIFTGRVLTVTPQMEESGLVFKSVVCEDRLGYLCDSIQPYTPEATYTLEDFFTLLLENHNSQVEDYKKIYPGYISMTTSSGNVTKGLNYQTTWECIKSKLLDSVGGEIQLYTGADGLLYLDYVEELGSTGTPTIALGKNMKSVSREIDPTSVITRLIPLGAKAEATDDDPDVDIEERLTIADVNNGVIYLDDEDAQAVYGIVEGIVEWEDVTEASNLLTKAQAWLDAQTVIDQITLTAVDLYLAGIEAEAIERYNYYLVTHEGLGLNGYYRVVKVTRNICNPTEITYGMGGQSKSLASTLTSASNNASSAAAEATAAVNAQLSKTVAALIVSNATITELTAKVATIEEAYIDEATINTLLAGYIKTDELEATVATFGYVTADSAVITDLTAEVANINSVLAGNIGAGTVQTVHLTSDNVVIDDAVITDAMIVDLTASKITAGTIYTSLVKIASDSGENLLIDGSTIQINDGTYVRVQIGEDASGDYNLYLWDADGNLLWDAGGLYAAGIHDGIIKDIAVADDAAISGTKLDISSVASELNKDGSLTVNAAQITIDDTTLEYRLTSMTTATDEAVAAAQAAQDMAASLESESVSSLTQYYAVGDSADEPPSDPATNSSTWVEDFPTIEDGDYLWTAFYVVRVDETAEWTTPTCLTDGVARKAVSTLQTELEVVQGQITAKVWQTDIDTAVSGISIGGRNYVLNSGGYSEGDDVAWSLTGGTSYYTLSVADGYTRIYCNTTTSSNYYLTLDLSDEFDVSAEHTVSFKVRLSSAGLLYLCARCTTETGASYVTLKSFAASNFSDGEWVTLSYTFTLDSDTYTGCTWIGFTTYPIKTAGYYLDIAYIKLEQGNVATDWTPAPEDTASTLTALTDKYASLTITLDSITTEVAELTTTVTDGYETLSSKVGTLETTADSITATVREMQVAAASNVIKDGTFDGYTTFGASYSWYRANSTYITVSTYDDTPCICFTRGGSTYYIRQSISLAAGTYLIRAKLACGADVAPVCRVRLGSDYAYLCADEELTDEWVEYSTTITTTATSSYFYLYCYASSSTTSTTATEMYVTDIEVYSTDDLYAAIAQIQVLSTSIEMCVTVEESTGYLRLGTGDDGTVKFTIAADNITLDEDGNLAITGTINCGDGVIGGWNIASTKIYGTAADGTTTAVMQISGLTEDTAYVFAAGGKSHSSYADCPFRVNKLGGMWVQDVVVAEGLTAGENISATGNVTGKALVGGNDDGFYCKNTSGTNIRMAYLSTNDNVVLGHSDYATYINGSTVTVSASLTTSSTLNTGSTITSGGAIVANNGTTTGGIYCKSSDSTNIRVTWMSSNDNIGFGHSNYATYLYGTSITSNVAITTSSDARLKTDITSLTDDYDALLDKLNPCSFRYTADKTEVLHLGFTVQDTESAMEAAGFDPDDYALTSWNEDPESGEVYGALAYSEIIALLVKQVQTLKSRVAALEAT